MADGATAAQLLLIAVVGGTIVRGAELLELRNTPRNQRPDSRDPWYWYPFLFHPGAGFFLVWVYLLEATPLTPLLALNIGASAPLIARALAEANPLQSPIDPGPGA
jgi:hypothetical protein